MECPFEQDTNITHYLYTAPIFSEDGKLTPPAKGPWMASWLASWTSCSEQEMHQTNLCRLQATLPTPLPAPGWLTATQGAQDRSEDLGLKVQVLSLDMVWTLWVIVRLSLPSA